MKESKKDIENAIVTVAKSLEIDVEIINALLTNVGIVSTIKELVYSAFVRNKQEYFLKDDETFEAYQLIRAFCNELSENGEVKFEDS